MSWKLANFARLDPSLQERNIAGTTHGSKGEIEVWEEFNEDWEALAFESARDLQFLCRAALFLTYLYWNVTTRRSIWKPDLLEPVMPITK